MSTPVLTEVQQARRKMSGADHPGTIRSYFPFWDAQLRPILIEAIERLPAEHFHFKPRPEMLTAHQILVHLAEAERGWLHHVVDGGHDEEWVVPHEDPSQGWKTLREAPDHASLLAMLEEWHRPTQAWFEKPPSELSRVIRYHPKEGPDRYYTIHWILDHVQEHEIHHRAQLFLYLRLLGIDPP